MLSCGVEGAEDAGKGVMEEEKFEVLEVPSDLIPFSDGPARGVFGAI